MVRRIALCAALVVAGALGTADAQQETIKRTPLQKIEVPDSKY